MSAIKVHDILKMRVLVARGTARRLDEHIAESIEQDPRVLTLDLAGIDGIAPSFMDEVLVSIERIRQAQADSEGLTVVVQNPPTHLSSKFEAVGRGHGLSIMRGDDGAWIIVENKEMS